MSTYVELSELNLKLKADDGQVGSGEQIGSA
jgi:hypothetical protein